MRVEVANQEVRPELVHDLHVVVDVTGGRGAAVLESARADLVVGLASLGFGGWAGLLLALEPHHGGCVAKDQSGWGHRRVGAQRIPQALGRAVMISD